MKKRSAKWLMVAGLVGPGLVLAHGNSDKMMQDKQAADRIEDSQRTVHGQSGMSDERRLDDQNIGDQNIGQQNLGQGGSGEAGMANPAIPDQSQTVAPDRPYRQGDVDQGKDIDKGAYKDTRKDIDKGMGGSAQAGMMDEKQNDVLAKIHADNMKEVQMGTLAKEKALSKDVKKFSERLIKDHQDADRKLSKLLDKHNLKAESLPQSDELRQMKEQDAQKMTDMGKLEGAAFDQQFLTMMVQDHMKTIGELTQAKATYANTDLGKFIGEILPTLQKHHDEAQRLLDKAGNAPTRARRPAGTTR